MHNRCQLIGRLGKDPIMKSFTDGGKIAEFPLATTEQYKDKEGNWKDIVDWHNIKISNNPGSSDTTTNTQPVDDLPF